VIKYYLDLKKSTKTSNIKGKNAMITIIIDKNSSDEDKENEEISNFCLKVSNLCFDESKTTR